MCADQGNLRQQVLELDASGVDFFHFDIMDGHFVSNLAMSPDMVKSLRGVTKRPFDVHLMLVQPDRYINRFADSGADSITVHAEANIDLSTAIQNIRHRGVKAGIALNPRTPVSIVESLLDQLDLVCLMSVEPGFAGQKFIESVLPKIDQLSGLIQKAGVTTRIEMDGNISLERIPDLMKRGASMFVAGTSILFRPDTSFAEAMGRARDCFNLETTKKCK